MAAALEFPVGGFAIVGLVNVVVMLLLFTVNSVDYISG